jgi:DivIVA domain-containing protein
VPLTPADVDNVAFSRPPVGRRGYDEDEVDAFLDLVEREFTRLIEETLTSASASAELDQELAAVRRARGAAATQTFPHYSRNSSRN